MKIHDLISETHEDYGFAPYGRGIKRGDTVKHRLTGATHRVDAVEGGKLLLDTGELVSPQGEWTVIKPSKPLPIRNASSEALKEFAIEPKDDGDDDNQSMWYIQYEDDGTRAWVIVIAASKKEAWAAFKELYPQYKVLAIHGPYT